MTETDAPDVRRELARIAEHASAYDVLDRAIARYRWRRGLQAAAAGALVLATLALTSLIPGRVESAPAQPATSGADATLPRTVGLPPVWTQIPDARRSPAGEAAVIFSGSGRPLHTLMHDGNVVAVGAQRDSYRMLPLRWESPAGVSTLLSADGARIAYAPDAAQPVRILDLRSGLVNGVPRAGRSFQRILAWSGDGSTLAVTDGDAEDADNAHLALVDVESGRQVDLPDSVGAFEIAFSRDSGRVAYQLGDHITVSTREGEMVDSFDVPNGERLGGKGAWSPNGEAIVFVGRAGCCSTLPRNPGPFSLHMRDAITGAAVPATQFRPLSGLLGLRVLGWGPGGSPVVVGYYPKPGAPTDDPFGLTSGPEVRRLEVMALDSGGGPPRVLLAPPDRILAVDVADSVLATGRMRPGHPASSYPINPWIVSTVVVSALAALLGGWLVSHLRRRRRSRWHPGAPASTN